MKFKLLAVIIISSITLSNAQEESMYGFAKGDFFIGGSVSFSSLDIIRGFGVFTDSIGNSTFSLNEDDITSFQISPEIGYFISNQIALGVDLSYTTINTERQDLDFYNIGVFGRYYYTPNKRFSIFNTLRVRYLSNETDIGNGVKLDTDGFNIGINAGVNYFLTKHFVVQSFVGLISYENTESRFNGLTTNNDAFTINLNISNIKTVSKILCK